MSKNSGFIGKQRKISFFDRDTSGSENAVERNTVFSAGGKNDTFDAYNARLENDWPANVSFSVTHVDSTLYRNTSGYAQFDITNGPTEEYGCRIINESANWVSGTDFSAANGAYLPDADGTTGITVLDDALRVNYRAMYRTPEEEAVTFEIEIYGLSTGYVYGTSGVITIPPTLHIVELGATAALEGDTVPVTFKIVGVGSEIDPYYRTFRLFQSNNYNYTYPRVQWDAGATINQTKGSYSITGTWDSSTYTSTCSENIFIFKSYGISDLPEFTELTLGFKAHGQASSLQDSRYPLTSDTITVQLNSTAPTIELPAGTLYEGTQYSYGVNFSEAPDPSDTFYIRFLNLSSGRWSDGTTTHSFTKSGSGTHYQNKTVLIDTVASDDNFGIWVENRFRNLVARIDNGIIMVNQSPSISSIAENFTTVEEGPGVSYQFQFNGQYISDKTLDWEITGAVSAADFANISSLSGTVAGNGTLELTTVADQTTEGNEDFTLTIRWNGATLISENYTLVDTSLDPPPPAPWSVSSAEFNTVGSQYSFNLSNNKNYLNMYHLNGWRTVYAGDTGDGAGAKFHFYPTYTYEGTSYYSFIVNKTTGAISGVGGSTAIPFAQNCIWGYSPDGTKTVLLLDNNLIVFNNSTPFVLSQNDTYSAISGEFRTYVDGVEGSRLRAHDMFDIQVIDGTRIIISTRNGSLNSAQVTFFEITMSTEYDPNTADKGGYNLQYIKLKYMGEISAVPSESIDGYLVPPNPPYSYGSVRLFEFSPDGKKLTIQKNDYDGIADSATLETYDLTTGFDFSTLQPSPASYQIYPFPIPDQATFESPSTYEEPFWFIRFFAFDRIDRNKLYVGITKDDNYGHAVVLDTAKAIDLTPVAGYNIETASLVDSNTNSFSLPYTVQVFKGTYGGDSQLTTNNAQNNANIIYIGNTNSSSNLQKMEFTPSYNSGSDLYNTAIQEPAYSQQAFTWDERRGFVNVTSNGTVLYWQGSNYNLFSDGLDQFQAQDMGQLPISGGNVYRMMDIHAKDMSVFQSGYIVLSYIDNSSDNFYILEGFQYDPGQNSWNSVWSVQLTRGSYNGVGVGKFEYNSDGTEITLIKRENGGTYYTGATVLETYDLSANPYNASTINTTNNSWIRQRDFQTELGSQYQYIVDFFFERQYPAQQLYIIASTSSSTTNTNVYRYTFEMDQQYLDNTPNAFSNEEVSLNPILVDYAGDGSSIDITFLTESSAQKFETFMFYLVNISTGFFLSVGTQGLTSGFSISAGVERSVSRAGNIVSMNLNGGVQSYSVANDSDNFNDVFITIYDDTIAFDGTGNTITVVLPDTAGSTLYSAFSESGCGARDFYLYGRQGIFESSDSTSLGGIQSVEGAIGFGFTGNVIQVAEGQEFFTPVFLRFNLTEAIIGSAEVSINIPSVGGGNPIEPIWMSSNGTSYVEIDTGSIGAATALADIANQYKNFADGSPSELNFYISSKLYADEEIYFGFLSGSYAIANGTMIIFDNINVYNYSNNNNPEAFVNVFIPDSITNYSGDFLWFPMNSWFESPPFVLEYGSWAAGFWGAVMPRVSYGTFSNPTGFRITEISSVNVNNNYTSWSGSAAYENFFGNNFISVYLTE